MTDFGDIGVRRGSRKLRPSNQWFGFVRQPSGNSFSIATSGVVGLYLKGNYVTSASGSSTVTFYDIDNGEYLAAKPDGSTSWSVVVTDSGVTVTPIVSGSSGTKSSAFVA